MLLTFEPNDGWSLWELIDMREELRELFGRDVDVVEKKNLVNPFRRHAILATKQVIYAAEQA